MITLKKFVLVCVVLALALMMLPDADSLMSLWRGESGPIPVMPTPMRTVKPHFPAPVRTMCPSCGVHPTKTPTICPSCGVIP